MRTAKATVKDPTIPRWVRWCLIIGLLPIPGPLDELAAGVAIIFVLVRHRECWNEHWRVQGMPAMEAIDTWGAWS